MARRRIRLLLEAEVAPKAQARFQNRYLAATGLSVSPGSPVHYQHQANKWGAELRVYFNDQVLANVLAASGLKVETRQRGYQGGYQYRVSNNKFWWKLVEDQHMTLGLN